jgi:trimethylamine--corrinoid protein Co-methyltransferase
MNTYATLLSENEVGQIHEASLEILEKVGLLVRNEKARAILARHGCRVETQAQRVYYPRKVVEEFRSMMPPTFTFYARDPALDRTIPDDSPVTVTGSSAPNIIDPLTGHDRRATSADLAQIAHLVNELSGYDVFSISTLAQDAPAGLFSVTRFYTSLKNCVKPVRGSGPSEDAEKILQLVYLIAGSEGAYREHPFLTHHYCPVVSPLTMDVDSTESLIFFSERKLPCYPTIVPNAGLTSPLTLVGTIAQGNAEFLAAAILEQMIWPGKTTIYATLPTVGDMRTGAYAPGAIETAMMMAGFAQMARFYNVPNGGYIGLTNSKLNDAQSGYETGMSAVAGLLGGVHMFNTGGLLDSLMTFDFAKAVIDDEIFLMMKRIQRGLEFSQENLALDVIAEVGPGGMYMDNVHTLERMRTTAFLPSVADRDARQQWAERGGLDSQAHAMQKVRTILTQENPVVFSPSVEARIRSAFPNLVAGDSRPPAGWEADVPAASRDRAERRRRRGEGGRESMLR